MENIKTSIFKQKIFEVSYTLIDDWWIDVYWGKLLEEKEIFRCDIPIPLLKRGEKFYIEEMDLVVNVSDVMRTSKDCILYYITSKRVETEESLKKKDELEKKVSKYNRVKKEDGILKKYSKMCWLYKKLVSYEKFKATHS